MTRTQPIMHGYKGMGLTLFVRPVGPLTQGQPMVWHRRPSCGREGHSTSKRGTSSSCAGRTATGPPKLRRIHFHPALGTPPRTSLFQHRRSEAGTPAGPTGRPANEHRPADGGSPATTTTAHCGGHPAKRRTLSSSRRGEATANRTAPASATAHCEGHPSRRRTRSGSRRGEATADRTAPNTTTATATSKAPPPNIGPPPTPGDESEHSWPSSDNDRTELMQRESRHRSRSRSRPASSHHNHDHNTAPQPPVTSEGGPATDVECAQSNRASTQKLAQSTGHS